MVVKRLFLAVCIAVPLCACAQQPESSSHARQLIARSMERAPGFNVVAVVLYRNVKGSETEQVKVEIGRDGRMHRVVLQPLSREGFESVDDGKELRTFVPDHKTILIQESPLLELSDSAFRLRLLDRNYVLREESAIRVAGRDAVSILAVPRHHDLLPRRLVLDAQSGYLLRLQVGTSDGKMDTRVEVKNIEFPNSLPASVFQMRTINSSRQIRFPKRDDLNPDNPPDDIHFRPIVPRRLPGGFVVQSAQVNRGRFRSIAVRITDGLVKGTVYESLPADAPPEMKMESATRVNMGDITLTLVMDAPPALRERILASFARKPGSGKRGPPPGNSKGTGTPPEPTNVRFVNAPLIRD